MDRGRQAIKVGARLRELREEKGFSLRGLALEAGISHTQLSAIENDQTTDVSPSLYTLGLVLEALHVSFAQFFKSSPPEQCNHAKHAELVQRFLFILHSKTELAHAAETNVEVMYRELLRRAKED